MELTKEQLESLGYVYFPQVGSFYRLGVASDNVLQLEILPANISGGGHPQESQIFDESDDGANAIGFTLFVMQSIAVLKKFKQMYPEIENRKLRSSEIYTGAERQEFLKGVNGELLPN